MKNDGGGIIDIANRRQIFVEGYKTRLAKNLEPFLKRMSKEVRARLGGVDLTDYSRERFEDLLDRIREDQKLIYQKWYRDTREQIIDYAVYESGFQARKFKELINVDFDLPSRQHLRAAVLTTPLSSLSGTDKAKPLYGFFTNHTVRQVGIMDGIIRGGYYQGLTTTDIIKSIIGTRAAGYQDGVLANTYRDLGTIVRTAVQHCGVVAREETYKENDDVIKGVQFVATLDDRTSIICASLDGQISKIGEGPRPPMHPNCRSVNVPVLDDKFKELSKDTTRLARGPDGKVYQVDADMTYYEWLKTQPKEFQNAAIGTKRAEVLRSGKLTAIEFAKMNISPGYKALTLKEMQALEPAVFAKL